MAEIFYHRGECREWWSAEEINNAIGASCCILEAYWVERIILGKEKWYSKEKVEEKISSPHLVIIFGTKSLPKWEGMIQIVSSYNFSSILVLCR
jgi:hypothetical protein